MLDIGADGKPLDKSYLEIGVPEWLRMSADAMAAAWERLDEDPFTWERSYYDVCGDINSAEVNGLISSEQAWYFREKYLHYVHEEIP